MPQVKKNRREIVLPADSLIFIPPKGLSCYPLGAKESGSSLRITLCPSWDLSKGIMGKSDASALLEARGWRLEDWKTGTGHS